MDLGPLKTLVSRKTIFFGDGSRLNFIVAWKEFAAKSIKLMISVSGRVQTENMS